MKRIPENYDFMTGALSNHYERGNRKKFSDRKGGTRAYAH